MDRSAPAGSAELSGAHDTPGAPSAAGSAPLTLSGGSPPRRSSIPPRPPLPAFAARLMWGALAGFTSIPLSYALLRLRGALVGVEADPTVRPPPLEIGMFVRLELAAAAAALVIAPIAFFARARHGPLTARAVYAFFWLAAIAIALQAWVLP